LYVALFLQPSRRFLELFRICDKHGIPRPTVLITEWGWTYEHVPSPEEAIEHVEWASRLYAPYPQVKGAAIWYLGDGYGDVEHETQRLIKPLMIYSLTHYVPVSPASATVPANPELYRP
jgi:hypothetical protein